MPVYGTMLDKDWLGTFGLSKIKVKAIHPGFIFWHPNNTDSVGGAVKPQLINSLVYIVFSILILVFAESNSARAIGQGGVSLLLTMYVDWHRVDTKNRYINIRKAILSVLKHITILRESFVWRLDYSISILLSSIHKNFLLLAHILHALKECGGIPQLWGNCFLDYYIVVRERI